MAQKTSKRDAINAIQNSDPLEILLERINRSENESSKKQRLNTFTAAVQKQIQDQRDVILIAVKVK